MHTKGVNKKLQFSKKHRKLKNMIDQATVNKIRAFDSLGRSERWIAKHLEIGRPTVRKYKCLEVVVGQRAVVEQQSILSPYVEMVEELFFKYNGNCAKVKLTLEEKTGSTFNERTVRRFCEGWRPDLKAKNAFIRFEVKPGHQMQIDFGEMDVVIGGEKVRVHFMVSYLKYSRRIFVKAYPAENQAAWKDATECAFVHFGGVPRSILFDNSRCLVKWHKFGEAAELTPGWESFCKHWEVSPIAASPKHPQTKGGVERMVRYTKENALVGESFASFDELNAYLEKWCLTVADNRVLNHVFEGSKIPKERFENEKDGLSELKDRTYPLREGTRVVDNAGLIRVDNELYRVPDSVKNKNVQILIDRQTIQVAHRGKPVITLDKQSSVYRPKPQGYADAAPVVAPYQHKFHVNPLQRSLFDYQKIMGGWNDKYRLD